MARPLWCWGLAFLPILYLLFRRSLVDFSRRQMLASLACRCLILTLLVLALSDLSWFRPSKNVFVVLAVDHSLSVGEKGQSASQKYVAAVQDVSKPENLRILPFASTPGDFQSLQDIQNRDEQVSAAQSVQPLHLSRSLSEWQKGSDLQAAVEIASAVIPEGFVPHIVLLTDGNETQGDAIATAAASDIRISTVPLQTRDDPEIQITAVNTPAQVSLGEPFRIEVLVDTNCDAKAVLDLFRGEFRMASEACDLKTGSNTFYFTQQIDQPEEFTVQIRRSDSAGTESFSDTFTDNNKATALVFAAGQPRVLLIEQVPELARPIEWALKEEGIEVEVRPPEGIPQSLADLQNFEVLMLSNIPANMLSSQQMDVVRQYVSELGGGFVMLGGDESFGLGGYYRTTIDEVLPVRSDFEKEKEKPGLGMVLLIDKSGSMGGQKIELAKEAARAAVELMGPKDQVGVLAFDGEPYWISQMTSGSQKGIVMDRIAGLEPGGGTTLYPAMQKALQALEQTTAKLKHVIILTDGYSTPGDFDGITQELAANRITVSTVGVGDADASLLEKIAEIGNGRHYFTADPASIPQIFAKETITASQSAIKEDPFLPILVRSTAVLEGVDFDEAPFLLGFVVTRPKATSEVILTTETGDPLLSWWRYGLGISVAFTSDAKSRWAAEWLSWNGYNRFWAQIVRHCMRKSASRGFVMDVSSSGVERRITIDSVDKNGQFLNGAETRLTLVRPDQTTQEIVAQQTAPGRYVADVVTDDRGTWQLQVTQTVDGKMVNQQSRGLVASYNKELRIGPTNEALLKQVAEFSGGEFQPDPTSLFDRRPDAVASAAVSLWPWLLSAAMLLLVCDVALRRIELPRLFGTDSFRSASDR